MNITIICGKEDPKIAEYLEYEVKIKNRIAEVRAEGSVYAGSDEMFYQQVSKLNNEIS